MRKQASSWIIKVLLFAIVAVFIFWGVGSFNAGRDTKVADVNGEIVSYDAYREAYDRLREQYRSAYGGAINDEMLKSMQLEEQALNQIIHRILMLQEASRLDIQVADQSIDKAIQEIPAFQNNGVFDEARAEMLLSQNRLSVADFRNNFREDLIIDKLRALVVDGVVANEHEAKEWFEWYNAEIDLNYMLFQGDHYKDIDTTDEEIAAHFKTNETDYRTEPQVKVSYLFFDPMAYRSQVEVPQEKIAEYYYDNIDEFKSEKTVEARHILLKLDADADAQTVAAKEQEARKIYELAKSGKAFDALAKQYSEGPTREKGGYLGEFKKEAMVKPFADKAFGMTPGEISEPVRTNFGWHIIKVENVKEANIQTLEAAADGIREKLIDTGARTLALQKAEKVYDATLFEGADLADVAQQNQVPVRTTEFFTPQGLNTPEIGAPRLFAEKAFTLQKMGISDIQDFNDGYYLLQVIDRIEAAIPSLDKVKNDVRVDLIRKKQNERAKADAQACLDALKAGKSLDEIAAQFEPKPLQTGFFKRAGSIPEIGYEQGISEAAFALGSDKTLPDQIFEGAKGWYVIQLKERRPPSEEGFNKEKSAIVSRLTEQKKQTTLQQWLADLRAHGTVEVNYDLVR
ncbi:MAG: hypothetical protein VR64_05780 [Desulfatitalea sp. BRH_c12]|nr:MAG: hypothetical protein VR64_05780 [Desulfatitalea sp. BRH_c12]